MEYDKRIINTSLVLNCFNTSFAEEENYKNKFGYFTDVINNYADLKQCYYGKLTGINKIGYQLDNNKWYTFFLPEGAVKPEKKEKPFTIAFFTALYDIGSIITFRRKGGTSKNCVIYNGYYSSKDGDDPLNDYLFLGVYTFTMKELFEGYEYFADGTWKSFKMKE